MRKREGYQRTRPTSDAAADAREGKRFGGILSAVEEHRASQGGNYLDHLRLKGGIWCVANLATDAVLELKFPSENDGSKPDLKNIEEIPLVPGKDIPDLSVKKIRGYNKILLGRDEVMYVSVKSPAGLVNTNTWEVMEQHQEYSMSVKTWHLNDIIEEVAKGSTALIFYDGKKYTPKNGKESWTCNVTAKSRDALDGMDELLPEVFA